jgi:catechol 2,3-dioxygenase-like lactoylglutathione lyase family enzyme
MSAAQELSAERPPFTIKSLNHVEFTVSSLSAAVEFWSRLLGEGPISEVVSSPTDSIITGYDGVRFSGAYFRLPNGVLLELFEYAEPRSVPPDSNETYVVGNAHIGLVVDDLDAARRHLQELGASFRSDGPTRVRGGVHDGGRTMYVRDRDGVTIEVLELPS